ncbi:tetratricopeptide repeat protein [bacterium]|nr:tetratricopeptide repeat protein [bacterium]
MQHGAQIPGDWADAHIVLAGHFVRGTRRDWSASLRAAGATIERQVTTATTLVIVGDRTFALRRGGRVSRNLLVAHLLQMRHGTPQILSEAVAVQWFPQLTGTSIPPGSASAEMSSPSSDLVHDLRSHHFADWQQARLLADWLTAGVSPQRIGRALHELGRWLPEIRHTWSTQSLQWDGRQLLLRLPSGQWCDQSGQLLLDVPTENDQPGTDRFTTLPLPDHRDPFGLAVRYEAEGNDAAAERVYRELLLSDGPDVDVCFNLANVLVRRAQRRAAMERLWLCVELSPRMVEAWYNLGLVAAELGERELAIRTLSRALELAPNFTAAHQALQCLSASTTEGR